ncbi:MAG TPA: choice-of-anchor tandem repeat GloVer-containing protein [Tepidisphaeraceae bacterium]|jgi:uncharacterized repeat protein (TIGR03803 family)|nr:choice-of-anchor tandem repeat GloVer-containing protein [Tepidisphaeraceae bacterium]
MFCRTNAPLPVSTTARRASQPVALEQLESRTLLSGTITQVAEFPLDYSDGGAPIDIVTDSNGNIFGVANANGANDTNALGEVFEIPAGSSSITVLYRFTGMVDGGRPTGLVVDSNNNLYGGTSMDGPNGQGTTFEIPAGTSTPILLAPEAITPAGVDASGNLYGFGAGGVAELVSGTQSLTEISTVSSLGFITLGADGNLYGSIDQVQNSDGTTNGGEVFEVDLSSTPATTSILATFPFDESTLEGPQGNDPIGVRADASGNVFGVAKQGGNGNSGVAFEIVKGSGTITPIDYFDNNSSSVGGTPICPPLLDGSDNLYGLNFDGGANQLGTLWEVPAGSGPATEGATQPAIDLSDLNVNNGIGGDASMTDPDSIIYYSSEYGGHGKSNGNTNKFDLTHTLGAGEGLNQVDQTTIDTSNTDITSAQSTLKTLRKTLQQDRKILGKDRSDQQARTELTQIQGQLNAAQSDITKALHELRTAKQELRVDENLTAQSDSYAGKISTLTAQLASAQGNAAAKIQKQITADRTAENTASNKLNSKSAILNAQLAEITSEDSTISSALSSARATLAALPL